MCTCVVVQLTAVDGRRAFVTLPNDPELVDILARNGVDISVSEGDQQGNYVSLLGARPLLYLPVHWAMSLYAWELALIGARVLAAAQVLGNPCSCHACCQVYSAQ